MGLFDYLGSASPMFMASQKRETPLAIDYDKLAPGVAPIPSWGGPKSPYKANEADIEEREQKETYARQMMGDLVKKYGSDPTAITKDPQFRQISSLMSMTPEEVLRLNNRLEQDSKTKDELIKDGGEKLNAVDYTNFLNTGQVKSVNDSFNKYLSTPTSRLENYQQAYNDLESQGTSKDFQETLTSAFALATGKSTTDIGDDLKDPAVRAKLMTTVGEHYGFTTEQITHMDNTAQSNYLGKYIGEQLTGKSANFLKGQYVSQTRETKGMPLPPSLDDQNMNPSLRQNYVDIYKQYINPKVSDADAEQEANRYYKSQFQQFVQERVSDAVKMHEEDTTKEVYKYQNIGYYLEDWNKKLDIGKKKQDMTGPYEAAYGKQIIPTTQTDAPTYQVKGKDGKYTDFTPKNSPDANVINTYSGFAFNFDPGKTRFDASSIGSNFEISGSNNDPKKGLKGGFVDHVGDATQTLATSRREYLELNRNGYIKLTPQQVRMIETGKGDDLTKEELENLDSTGSLRNNFVVDQSVFMPRSQYTSGKLRAQVREDDKIKEDDLYHTEWQRIGGKEINENLTDPDAIQYVGKDDITGKKYGTDGYLINGKATLTPMDLHALDDKIKELHYVKSGEEGSNTETVNLDDTSGSE